MTSTSHEDTPTGAVVVGVDGSTDSHVALDWAARHAAAEHRPLLVLHAADTAAAFSRGYVAGAGVDAANLIEDTLEAGRRLTDEALTEVRLSYPDLRILTRVSRRDPREALLTAAERASMVVVGSRGRGPVTSLLLGSVGVAVSRHACCPVVVLRPGHPASAASPVVAAVDASPRSGPVLEMAFRYASIHAHPLTVLHTHPDQAGLAYGVPAFVRTVDVANALPELAEAIAKLSKQFPEVAVRTELRSQLVVDALLGVEASLVVVGRKHPPGLRGAVHVGVATSLIEHATGPVAVVPVSCAPTTRRRATR